MTFTEDDKKLFLKNFLEGVSDYLERNNKKYGKIYVTPHGTYEVLRKLEQDTNNYRKTLLRRFKSKRKSLSGWYVISGDLPLQPDELCLHCDAVDDMLFREDCWLDRVEHDHDTGIPGDAIIKYLYKGVEHQETFSRWKAGYRPHLTKEK